MTTQLNKIEYAISGSVSDINACRQLPQPLFDSALVGAFKGMITIGRLSVLEDFDAMCEADACIGLTESEWAAVKKFFELNKAISRWDIKD